MSDTSIAGTPKGARTRRQIVEAAKGLFHQKGYAQTSVKDICAESRVKAGTLTYYFRTKYDLVREIYEEIFSRSYEFVEERLDREVNSLEKNALVAFIYFQALSADENTRRFHLEILEQGSVGDYIARIAFPVARQYIKDFKLGFTDRELNDINMADNGISRELFTDFLKNPRGRSVQDMVNTIYIFRARLFTVDENIMKVYLYNGMEFSRTFDHAHIALLGPDEGQSAS